MADIRIIVDGIARREGNGWFAVPNTVLLTDGKHRVLVDPGNHPKLLELLEVRSIWPEEIGTVFLTHSHIDHSLNIKLFPDADIIDGQFIHRGMKMTPHDGIIPGTAIEVIPTPGHTHDHASLIVGTPEGKAAICGDLFWWESSQEQRTDHNSLIFLEDPFAVDIELLMSSRRTMLEIADRFIPGHGQPFIKR
ncbi:MAG: MBL fold metallo-hydrolase [Candidatus Thermoplasmatota archaeon]|nr:MBL fold metallo-hydrolase [Candidatus Thermoplasmatota archaeon]